MHDAERRKGADGVAVADQVELSVVWYVEGARPVTLRPWSSRRSVKRARSPCRRARCSRRTSALPDRKTGAPSAAYVPLRCRRPAAALPWPPWQREAKARDGQRDDDRRGQPCGLGTGRRPSETTTMTAKPSGSTSRVARYSCPRRTPQQTAAEREHPEDEWEQEPRHERGSSDRDGSPVALEVSRGSSVRARARSRERHRAAGASSHAGRPDRDWSRASGSCEEDLPIGPQAPISRAAPVVQRSDIRLDRPQRNPNQR